MAHTSVADIIKTESFLEYVFKGTNEKSALVQSGVCVADPGIANRCKAAGFGGNQVHLPFFADLSGEDQVLSGDLVTVNKLTAGDDIAPILRRVNAWGLEDIAADMAGADPLKALGDRVISYWNRRHKKALFASLDGVFGDNVAHDSSDLVLDISGEDGEDAYLGKSTLLLAAQKLGDAKNNLVAVAMNSAAETALSQFEGQGNLYRPSETPGQLSRYNGRQIIVDDMCGYNASTGVAEIYLFGAGAVAMNDVPERVLFEVARQAEYNRDAFFTRSAWIGHLRGVAWKGSPVKNTASNTELATAANWDRVYDKKDVRAVKLICKIA